MRLACLDGMAGKRSGPQSGVNGVAELDRTEISRTVGMIRTNDKPA